LSKREDELKKELRSLYNHIFRMQRHAKAEGLWLCMGKTVGLPEDSEHQEGANVKKLYELAERAKKVVKGK
jgi:hypothetical protein